MVTFPCLISHHPDLPYTKRIHQIDFSLHKRCLIRLPRPRTTPAPTHISRTIIEVISRSSPPSFLRHPHGRVNFRASPRLSYNLITLLYRPLHGPHNATQRSFEHTHTIINARYILFTYLWPDRLDTPRLLRSIPRHKQRTTCATTTFLLLLLLFLDNGPGSGVADVKVVHNLLSCYFPTARSRENWVISGFCYIFLGHTALLYASKKGLVL